MNWNLLSKYRSELMGLATIAVVLFHFFEEVGQHASEVTDTVLHLYNFGRYGYIGVEVFLIVSGIGCYYSIRKNFNKKEFYKKRAKRILIPYLLIAVPFWLYIDVFLNKSIEEFIYDLTGISFLIDTKTFWYVFFILIMYFLFPLIYKFLFGKEKDIFLKFMFIELLVAFLTIILYVEMYDVFDLIEIALTRVPIFIFGVYTGHKVYNNEKVSFPILFFSIFSIFLINIDFDNQLVMRYINSVQSIGFSLIMVKIFDIVNLKNINRFLSFVGKYSFEIYLLHIAFRRVFDSLDIRPYEWNNYLIIILLTVLFTWLVQLVTNTKNKRVYK